MRLLVHFLVYTNVLVALCAVALTWATDHLYAIRFQPQLYSFVFAATLASYNFQRLIKFRHIKADDPNSRLAWMHKYRGVMIVITLLSSALALFFYFKLNLLVMVALLPFAAVSVLYSVKFIPVRKARWSLRDVPGIKILLIAASWAFTTVLLPAMNWEDAIGLNDTLEDAQLWRLAAERFCFILAITIPFDIRDLRYDEASKRTLPQLLGESWAIGVAEILLLVSVVLGWQVYAMYRMANPIVMVGAFALIGLLIAFSNEKRHELFFSGAVEATMLLYAGAVWLS